MHYYETTSREGNKVCAFDTLEEAIEYANDNDGAIISEIGGSWEDFEKCWFCGEWVSSSEINKDSLCWRCELALRSRGEI